jgi:hypothetical protein
MVNTVVTVLAVALGVHALVKFAFFALPYARRRAAVDKQYGGRAYAGQTADPALMAFTVVVSVLLVWRGVEGVSFLAGLWIGATIIQLFFHRFHRYPASPDHGAPEPTSPLKHVSYAIQDAPWRAWPQMALMAALVAVGIVAVATGAFAP